MDADSEIARHVGARIRKARKAKGLSQNALARQIPDPSVSAQYVSRWERGENLPSWANLRAITAALDVSLAWLFNNGAPF